MPFHPKKLPYRSISAPTGKAWRALCDLLGIQSERDLARALELATRLQDTARAMSMYKPEEQDESLRLDRKLRYLALRRWCGNLNEKILPPNTLRDLETLPALIKLDYSRLCTWHVQELISQIHAWAVEGTEEERQRARGLAEMVGRAFVLSAGRGRPPNVLSPEDALCGYKSDLQRVKKGWIQRVAARVGVLRRTLVTEFADYPEKVIPDEDFICSSEATPSTVTYEITSRRFEVSVRHLADLLAKARKHHCASSD